MLINVYRDKATAIPGTRLLTETLNVVGVRIADPIKPLRAWEVQGIYLPVRGRVLGGVRIRLTDQKGFVTFCNQRDFEVLVGLGIPGNHCPWAGEEYLGPGDDGWYGLCCDEDDLLDDLFERELFLRAQMPGGVLVPGYDIERRVYLGGSNDCEELYVLLADMDPETGMFPDPRFETLERRWMRSERRKVRWDRL